MVNRKAFPRTRVGLVAIPLLALLALPAFGANVVATVDRNQVGVNESFRLSFEADDAVGAPDFSVLKENFEILDQSQNQSISITSGRTSRKYQWNLVLMALREGIFQIPPISFGGVRSQPISVVVKAGADIKEADKSIYLDVEVDVQQPFVQQQVMFTVRLFRSVDVASATLSDLAVEGVDALVERFGEDESYQMVRNGKRWLVVERKYLVFPQQSGYLTIRPLEFRGRRATRQSNFGLNLFDQPAGSPVVLRSESVTIAVREPPASFAGRWLPARRLTLEETWPQEKAITEGEPVTRSVAIEALGLTAAQLPELEFELPDGFRIYPEQPALEDTGHEDGVVGTRVQSMAIIPTRPGAFTLPEVQLAWWNVGSGQPEIAVIPPRTVNVLSASASAVQARAPLDARVPDPLKRTSTSAGPPSRWWPWLTAALAAAWLVTLVLWAADRRRSPRAAGSPTDARPAPAAGPAQAAFDRACAVRDAPRARDALLDWGAATWPDAPPRNLGHLAARCGEPLEARILELERHLYGNGNHWEPAGMPAQLRGFVPATATAPPKTGVSLEPMYRS